MQFKKERLDFFVWDMRGCTMYGKSMCDCTSAGALNEEKRCDFSYVSYCCCDLHAGCFFMLWFWFFSEEVLTFFSFFNFVDDGGGWGCVKKEL